jgi:hypothetical protein
MGDVYYSGMNSEVQKQFLDLWPKVPNAVSRACNSNHEMYTGGHAYFDLTLKQFEQPASYFAMQNDHWLLIGLDSAYIEGRFKEDQLPWLNNLIANAGGRKVVLFTHHQLFSWAEKKGARLEEKIGQILKDKNIFAWYWGHEHRCMIYDQHPAWGLYGRCIGHSGYPYFKDQFNEGRIVKCGPQDSQWRQVGLKGLVPGGLILEGPNPYVEGHAEKYGPQGYMTLEFRDDQLNEIVHTPDGEIALERQIP